MASAMNTAAMSYVLSQYDDLMVKFWAAVNTVSMVKLLPVITFLTFWTAVGTMMV